MLRADQPVLVGRRQGGQVDGNHVAGPPAEANAHGIAHGQNPGAQRHGDVLAAIGQRPRLDKIHQWVAAAQQQTRL